MHIGPGKGDIAQGRRADRAFVAGGAGDLSQAMIAGGARVGFRLAVEAEMMEFLVGEIVARMAAVAAEALEQRQAPLRRW